jgi:predicted permease
MEAKEAMLKLFPLLHFGGPCLPKANDFYYNDHVLLPELVFLVSSHFMNITIISQSCPFGLLFGSYTITYLMLHCNVISLRSIIFLQMLARLLKSKHPEDLQAANRLIKNMVKQVRHPTFYYFFFACITMYLYAGVSKTFPVRLLGDQIH